MCVLNSATENTPTTRKTAFIKSCLAYSMSSKGFIICTDCAVGFSLTDDSFYCVESSKVANCAIFSVTNDDVNRPACFRCLDTFVLENGICIAGTIKKCLVYIDRFNCQKCSVGTVATNVFYKQYTFCFDVQSSLAGCSSFDENLAFFGYLKCLKCEGTKYLVELTQPITTCAGFPTTEDCIEYQIDTTFQTSNFVCKKCKQNFYLFNFLDFQTKCILRKAYPIRNCLTYSVTEDKCINCILGYFLDSSLNRCFQNPNGILGCRNYDGSIIKCKECDGLRNYFNVGGDCNLISDNFVTDNCYKYNAQKLCTQCKQGYTLDSNKCNLTPAVNCKVLDFENSCIECDANYFLINRKCETSILTNCRVFASASVCKECEPGYYLNGERCSIPKQIENCSEYDSGTTCKTCSQGKILSQDKQKCSTVSQSQSYLTQSNCLQYSTTPECIYCEKGVLFQD
jgi:hypothetical protein